MENLALGSPKPVLGFHHSPEPGRLPLGLSLPIRKSSSFVSSRPRYRTAVFSLSSANSAKQGKDKIGVIRLFASVSSSATGARETTSVGVNPLPPTPPPSQFGSPLFWIGVGVGFSALFSLLASNLKKYAMQQAFKTMMGQMGSQSNTSPPAFSPGYPFPFTPPSTATPATSSRPTTSPQPAISLSPTASQDTVTVDVSAKKDEVTPAASLKEDVKIKTEPKRCAFVDVSPDDTLLNTPFEKVQEPTTSSKDTKFTDEATQNGTAQNGTWAGAGAGTGAGFGAGAGAGSGKAGPFLSVEALEKMLEDPTVQKMVYPYLPEEMRNPATFKWMVQNPVYRQQLQDMLNNMGGSSEWDNRMMDSLKNFDLSSPEVKQQFDQIGVTPEEVISKIMANPDVAIAFQNPRVQAAIMDCSQNPFNIAKYQNDKEVMDVFNKISELFPGLTGSP